MNPDLPFFERHDVNSWSQMKIVKDSKSLQITGNHLQ